jgi:hypothetical protein
MKLGIIVPYRDRPAHLKKFTQHTFDFLKQSNIEFEIVVVEQIDDKPFNRGKLLNVGYLKAKELGCNYVVFHDVDMLPIEVDYSYSEVPLHLATNFDLEYEKAKNLEFDDYFGGVTMMSNSTFETINGYSNLYWGWGFEDDDLLFRCAEKNILLDKKVIGKKEVKKIYGLYFNGKSSYIKIPKKDLLNFENDLSILISFKPDEIVSSPMKEYDEYTAFSIPGYDTNISYNSFRRYKCDVWDEENNATSINSEILTNHFTQICLVWDSKKSKLSFYKDGEIIESKIIDKKILDYSNQEYFYIGVGDPNRQDNNNYFYGVISEFAIYGTALKEKEIIVLSENVLENSLLENFRGYKSANQLKLYYDFKFYKDNKLIDLTGNQNYGEINNCHFVKVNESLGKEIFVPYRRESTFKLLSHKPNSWDGNNWVHKETRINQLRFLNEVKKHLYNIEMDGLSNCKYQIINDASYEKLHHLSVLL